MSHRRHPDAGDALFRRWVVLTFPNKFEGNGRDPDMVEKLTTPAELAGLFVRAVHGLRRLRDRRDFDLPASAVAAGEEFRRYVDTTTGFLEECCERIFEPGLQSRPALYRAYEQWCRDNGRRAYGANRFAARLRDWVARSTTR